MLAAQQEKSLVLKLLDVELEMFLSFSAWKCPIALTFRSLLYWC